MMKKKGLGFLESGSVKNNCETVFVHASCNIGDHVNCIKGKITEGNVSPVKTADRRKNGCATFVESLVIFVCFAIYCKISF